MSSKSRLLEFVHTDASIEEILDNTVERDGFIPIATREYTIHGLRRCGRTTALQEALARGDMEHVTGPGGVLHPVAIGFVLLLLVEDMPLPNTNNSPTTL